MNLDYDPGRIIECEVGAEALQWEAAERIYAGTLIKFGKDVAVDIGKSPAHVTQMAKLGQIYLGKSITDRPPFNEAYQAAKGGKREKPESAPVISDTASTDEVVQAIRNKPELIQAVLRAVKADRPQGSGRNDLPDNGKLKAIYDLNGHLREAVGHLEKAEQAGEESWGGRADMALDAIETIVTRLRETRNHVQAGSAGPEGGVPGVSGVAEPISLARARSLRQSTSG